MTQKKTVRTAAAAVLIFAAAALAAFLLTGGAKMTYCGIGPTDLSGLAERIISLTLSTAIQCVTVYLAAYVETPFTLTAPVFVYRGLTAGAAFRLVSAPSDVTLAFFASHMLITALLLILCCSSAKYSGRAGGEDRFALRARHSYIFLIINGAALLIKASPGLLIG